MIEPMHQTPIEFHNSTCSTTNVAIIAFFSSVFVLLDTHSCLGQKIISIQLGLLIHAFLSREIYVVFNGNEQIKMNVTLFFSYAIVHLYWESVSKYNTQH
jgi:hypothetical protein